jgi:raffinose/stachyose/melibiose transport system substrate-binding protein
MSAANQRRAAETGALLPTNKAAADGIKDVNNQHVAQALASATGFQLYLDQAYPPAVGAQVNDSVAGLIAGSKTPDQVTADITKTAKEN